jgi:ribosomal protein L29
MAKKSNNAIQEKSCMPNENNTAIQWRELDVEELRTRVPALKNALADLERAKAISQETLKAEISV